MRVAIFTDTYLPQVNGVVSYLESTLPRIARTNDVVLFAPGERKKISVEEKGKRFRIYWIPASSFPYYEGYRMSKVALKDIERILKKERIDMVHAHAPVLLGLQGMMIAKKLKIPIVATYHTHLPDYLPYLLDGKFPGFLNSISQKTVKGLIRLVYCWADESTAPSEELVKELQGYGVKNTTRLPNGVDLDRMKSSEKLKQEFVKQYRIPRNKKIILYVGRVGFEKRLGTLLDAVKRLKTKKFQLVVVGSGPQLENYKHHADMLGLQSVIFTGFVEDRLLPAAYSVADVFVSPSDSETFGLTFIEAMATGLPVIGVNKLGPKELIKNGKNGFLVKAGDSRDMARKIEKLLSDSRLRKKMGEEAKNTAKGFSIDHSVKETIRIYRRLKKLNTV